MPHDILSTTVNPRSQVLALLLVLAGPMTSSELAPEVLLLARIRQAAREGLSQIPAYACQESVERFTRRSRFERFHKTDGFQVQVAQIGDKELFARPGDQGFQDKPLSEMVRPGMVATGLFYVMAHSVFLGKATIFTYHGPEKRLGDKAVRYDYRIAQIFSTYQISSNGYNARVAMEGSVWADAKTNEVLELEVRTVEIPPQLRMLNAVTRITYNSTQMGERKYLIPSSAVVTTVSDNGLEGQNRTAFRDCHRYTGESKITF
jgi:hypothetical protein